MGQILAINLTDHSMADEPLPSEVVLRKYVGGTGLGVYYLHEALRRETTRREEQLAEGVEAYPMDPWDEEAPLIFMTGPLTGTDAPCSANYTTVCINLEASYAAGVGHSHGFWGPYLKFAGYDGIVIEGRSDPHVMIVIDDGNVEIRNADHLWGLDTRETERQVKEEMGGDPEKVSVACIGPGGEAMIHGGMIKNDRNHGAGKGSPGAIMGSKRLKAIAVRGTKAVPIANHSAFQEAVARWEKELAEQPKSGPFAQAGKGVNELYPALGDQYVVAYKNLTDPEGGKAFAESYSQIADRWPVTAKPCYNCKIACAYDVEIADGPFAGKTVSLSGGSQGPEGAAAMIGVQDPGVALGLTDYYDALGLESSTMGCAVAMAFEAYEKGLITKEDTGDLDLTWGNHEAVMEMLSRMVSREGHELGGSRPDVSWLASGLGKAAFHLSKKKGRPELQQEIEEISVHVKGAGISIHDLRNYWGTLLGQIVSPAGPGWHAPAADFVGPQPDSGYAEMTPGVADTEEEATAKAREVRQNQRSKLWHDCTGVCWFAQASAATASRAIGSAVGWDDLDTEEALDVGERAATAMRLISLQRDFIKRYDRVVSPRLLEAPPTGPAAGKSIGPYLRAMVDEYYREMGWEVKNGRPTPETLARLGL
jgi:aldehyde:ferredoxin oxidoreductase